MKPLFMPEPMIAYEQASGEKVICASKMLYDYDGDTLNIVIIGTNRLCKLPGYKTCYKLVKPIKTKRWFYPICRYNRHPQLNLKEVKGAVYERRIRS